MSWLPLSVRRHLPGWRADTPEAFLAGVSRPAAGQLVVCAGDSNTQGQVSANYVARLGQRLGPAGYQFVNAGTNGHLAYNVAQRLDEIVACRPDVVTLLVGTNDVNSQFDDGWRRRYTRDQRLPVAPSLAWYRENLATIFERLRRDTTARVAVLEIPVLGEDLGSRMNDLVRAYNAALHEVAADHGVAVLPLHDRLCELLPPGHAPPPYAGELGPIARAALASQVLGRSWDAISDQAGMALLTDHLHLNDRAAAVVADLVSGFILQREEPRRP